MHFLDILRSGGKLLVELFDKAVVFFLFQKGKDLLRIGDRLFRFIERFRFAFDGRDLLGELLGTFQIGPDFFFFGLRFLFRKLFSQTVQVKESILLP